MEDPGNSDQDAPIFSEHSVDLMDSPRRKWPSLSRRTAAGKVVDLADVASHPDMPAHRKLLSLVLLLAMKDRSTGIHLEPCRHEGDSPELGLRMLYEVDEQFHDLVPPPSQFAKHIIQDVKAIANLDTLRSHVAGRLRRLASLIDGQPNPPRQGRFRVCLGENHAELEVLAYPHDLGEHLVIRPMSVSEAFPEGAHETLNRLIKDRWEPTDSHEPRRDDTADGTASAIEVGDIDPSPPH